MSKRVSAYYHRSIFDFLRFTIPADQAILFFQAYPRLTLQQLEPRRCVTVEPLASDRPASPGSRAATGFSTEGLEGPFDYIVLCDVLGFCPDIGTFLRGLTRLCDATTRLIVLQHSYLWTPILRLGERLGLKRPGGLECLLSKRDLVSYMTASGFQHVSHTAALLCPLFLLGLGPAINFLGRLLPGLGWLKLNQYSIFRLEPAAEPDPRPSLTICLTCRDEAENIEPLVQSIPRLAPEQEILFVEGHSRDDTRGEILRVQERYPDKGVRLIGQPGEGQGDAIREGFSQARGEVIILLESDRTSPAENIAYFYDCLRRNQGEFIEGSRFVYPLPPKAMPLLNRIGNALFAAWISILFNQYMTDVLSGIKGIHKWSFDRLVANWGWLGMRDPFGDFELLFGAMRLGLKSVELPMHYHPRPYGRSKTRVFTHGAVLVRLVLAAYVRFRR